MAAPMDENAQVELGFLSLTDSWKLKSKYFPSKVGGKPAWLNLRDLPTDTTCGYCGGPLVFLLQIYAPVNSLDRCFHRTLFVFYCDKPSCCHPNEARCNFAVYRCQLPRQNEFYPYEPPVEREDDRTPALNASQYGPLCVVCDGRGPKRCARCHMAAYCSKEHQIVDWRAGHKIVCKENGSREIAPHNTDHLFLQEFELIIELESAIEEEEHHANGALELKGLEVKQFDEKSSIDDDMLKPEDYRDLEDMASSNDDKQFRRFRKRIDLDPEQILRFHRGGKPLWVSNVVIPDQNRDIEKCVCGSPRQFEFQILPQLLNHLKIDAKEASVDWGTLAIYTCSENCDISGYIREFIWKQDFTSDVSKRSSHFPE